MPDASLENLKPATIHFFGRPVAELFSKEVELSIEGVLANTYVSTDNSSLGPKGFIAASTRGYACEDTCWTRDCGAFLREASLWGYTEPAINIAHYLISYVSVGEDGHYTFPMFFQGQNKGSGSELDGTCIIVVGLIRLWQRLPDPHHLRARIYAFLHSATSPMRYIHEQLKGRPLLAGSGEFGGGWGVHAGQWCNVVQNTLARQALIAAASVEDEAGDADLAARYRADAQQLAQNMEKLLVGTDGAWIWCIHPETLRAPREKDVDYHACGTASLNGAAAAQADAEGTDCLRSSAAARRAAATLAKVYDTYPQRKEQFQKYGMCTFIAPNPDTPEPFIGFTSWLSYCDCYAAEVMALLGRLDLLDKVMTWIAGTTYMAGSPTAEFLTELASGKAPSYLGDCPAEYWFSERNFSPAWRGQRPIGCGKLNLINVAEPAKLARLMAGVDDCAADIVKIAPRLPASWQGYDITNWPLWTGREIVRVDVHYKKTTPASHVLRVVVKDGRQIPKLTVNFPDGQTSEKQNVAGEAEFFAG